MDLKLVGRRERLRRDRKDHTEPDGRSPEESVGLPESER